MSKAEVIRVQDEETLSRCLKIRGEVFTTEKGVPREIEADAFDCLGGTCDHFLIRFNGADAGAFRLAYTKENTARIQRLCILKKFRGLGLGKSALEQIELFCRTCRCTAIELDPKCSASPFYEKCGYKTVSAPFTEADVMHIKMRKEL